MISLLRSKRYSLRIAFGELLYLDGKWYITHSGLLRIARRNRCSGIQVRPAFRLSDPAASRWAFKATVYKSKTCRGFVGYGDADPSNVSFLVHGAEMRVAETRAVNRALRKAYGIGICSVEEIGSFAEPPQSSRESKKLPRLLSGNDLCGFPGWGQPRQRRSADAAVFDDEILQISARREAAAVSVLPIESRII